jgi:hypothetical protein
MFDVPFYIAEEYYYKNKIYKGRYPISIIDDSCEVVSFTPRADLIEELDEDDIIKLETNRSTDKKPEYILTQTGKAIYPII